jgi:DNA-binding PadR family transcriptional regulator
MKHDVERHLPLKRAVFHILLALGDGARHGYGIRADVEALTGGAVKLWPVTMYGTLRELGDAGLIEAAAAPADEQDGRRQYYELTLLGRRVLRAETARLRALVEHAERTQAMRAR